MTMLHKDTDILKYEPALFTASTAFAAQSFGKGANGVLNGTTLTVSGGTFQTVGVQAGHVIYLQSLDGMINGVYEIVAVVNNTTLTVSALRAETTDPAIPIGTGSGLIWRIITFAPQAAQATFALSQRLGLKPGCPDSLYGFEDLTDASVLKQASVFTAIAIIYSGLYGSGTGAASDLKATWDMYQAKQEHYTSCAEAAIQCCRLSLED
jgi:hypothetical protein